MDMHAHMCGEIDGLIDILFFPFATAWLMILLLNDMLLFRSLSKKLFWNKSIAVMSFKVNMCCLALGTETLLERKMVACSKWQ
jgi:hypothetical protein